MPGQTQKAQKRKRGKNGKPKGKMAAGIPAAPAAIGTKLTARRADLSNIKDGIRVRHSEFVWTLLNSSTGWSLASFTGDPGFRVNPANSLLFPWLSSIASSWERYRFLKFRVKYIPRCSSATSGFVQMAHDADVLDAAPINERAMLSYAGAVDVNCWASVVMDIPVNRLNGDYKTKYVSEVVPEGGDPKTYDSGKLYFASGGSTAEFGKIFVEYEVELTIPQIATFAAGVVVTEDPSTASPNYPLGNNPVIQNASKIGVTYDSFNNLLSFTNLSPGSYYSLIWEALANSTNNVFHLPTGSTIYTTLTSGLELVSSYLSDPSFSYFGVNSSVGRTTGGVFKALDTTASLWVNAAGSAAGSTPSHSSVTFTPIVKAASYL